MINCMFSPTNLYHNAKTGTYVASSINDQLSPCINDCQGSYNMHIDNNVIIRKDYRLLRYVANICERP